MIVLNLIQWIYKSDDPRYLQPVGQAETIPEIQAMYKRLRDESGEGASTWPNGQFEYKGEVYTLSYNGRIWDKAENPCIVGATPGDILYGYTFKDSEGWGRLDRIIARDADSALAALLARHPGSTGITPDGVHPITPL